jgi:hypothetical protein
MIWKERNVAKYQKKNITKLKMINLIKSEISFIFTLAKSKTGNNIYTEMTTTQWPKKKVQKDKKRSTKHTYQTKDRVT